MNPRKCLDWCLEYQGRYPKDIRTCRHVVEWLATSARKVTNSDHEENAVNQAEIFANVTIKLYECSIVAHNNAVASCSAHSSH